MRAKISVALTCCLVLLACEWETRDTLPTAHATYCYSDASHFELLRDRLEQSGIDFDADEVKNCVAVYDAADAEQFEAIRVELFGTFPPSGSVSMGEEINKEFIDLLNSHGIETETHYWRGSEYISWAPEDAERAKAIEAEMFPPSGSISRDKEGNKEIVDLLNSHGIETKTHYWRGKEYISWPPDDYDKAEKLLESILGEGCCPQKLR